jgi:hypothetical protein
VGLPSSVTGSLLLIDVAVSPLATCTGGPILRFVPCYRSENSLILEMFFPVN